jgi:hypothetical protein
MTFLAGVFSLARSRETGGGEDRVMFENGVRVYFLLPL